jgi:hypothetical protein
MRLAQKIQNSFLILSEIFFFKIKRTSQRIQGKYDEIESGITHVNAFGPKIQN